MTVVIGLVGPDGAVMASDSEGSEAGHSRRDVEKCWTCGGLLMGLSGTDSVRQPLQATLESAVVGQFGENAETDRWEARELLRTKTKEVLTREYGAFVAQQPGEAPGNVIASALLVIGRDAAGYWLLELDPNNQPTFYTDHGGFHTIGSGSGAAYLAHGLMKGYEPGERTVDHLKLVAYRTVNTCIEVLAGRLGVGGEVQLHASRQNGPFEREAAEGLAVLRQGVEQWTTIEAESLGKVVLGEAPPEENEDAGTTLPEPIEE